MYLIVVLLSLFLSVPAYAEYMNSNVTIEGTLNTCVDAGSTDTYACTISPAPKAYHTGSCYTFKANTANTGAASLNLNSLGAKTIKKVAGGVTTDLADNDIRAGQVLEVCYDGTNMQLMSLLGTVPAGGVTGLANPTGTIGLSVVNGSATTVLRSDSAPALSQSIVPTWTGAHTFSSTVNIPHSTTLPSTCAVADIYMDTDAISGSRWYLCESTNTWVAQTGPIFTPSGSASTLTSFGLAGNTLIDAVIGTVKLSGATAGSIPYIGAGGVVSEDSRLTWSPTTGNLQLGLGQALPSPFDSVFGYGLLILGNATDGSGTSGIALIEGGNRPKVTFKFYNGSVASPTGVDTDTVTGQINWQVYNDHPDYDSATDIAYIRGTTDGAATANGQAGRLDFLPAEAATDSARNVLRLRAPTSAAITSHHASSSVITSGQTELQLGSGGSLLLSSASSYINFSTTPGTSGYGIRDNAGTIECKNSAGSWSACQDGSGGGGSPAGTSTEIQYRNGSSFGANASIIIDTNSTPTIAIKDSDTPSFDNLIAAAWSFEKLHLATTGGGASIFYHVGAPGAPQFVFRRADNSDNTDPWNNLIGTGSLAVVGMISFEGYTTVTSANTWALGAKITAEVDGALTHTFVPMAIKFYTQTSGDPAFVIDHFGAMTLTKITATGTAPGTGYCKEEWVAGTNAGTCKKIAYCGTSSTAVTEIDNVGGSC